MPRTTIAIDDDLFRRLKRRAAQEDTTLQDVVNDVLREGLARQKRRPYAFKLEGWRGTLQAGADLTDRDQVFDLAGGR